MDALYACAPLVRRIEKVEKWRYVIGTKESGNAHLFNQFDRLDEKGKVNWIDHVNKKDQAWEIAYCNSSSHFSHTLG